MRTHVDWLTFTMPMIYTEVGATAYSKAVENAFTHTFDAQTLKTAFEGGWSINERSRAPYPDSWRSAENGSTFYASPDLPHCCLEISGEGCERLIQREVMGKILAAVYERATRLDVACDIETNVTPTEFATITSHERMRASGYQKSETGETFYLGSQKSDRYARVYRYNAPHPRSHLLRIEHVFRRDYAKIVSQRVVEDGIHSVARACGSAFGWSHPAWQPEASEDSDISSNYTERKMGKTLWWLIKSCAPAFKRLVSEGTIQNPEEFVQRYFLDF